MALPAETKQKLLDLANLYVVAKTEKQTVITGRDPAWVDLVASGTKAAGKLAADLDAQFTAADSASQPRKAHLAALDALIADTTARITQLAGAAGADAKQELTDEKARRAAIGNADAASLDELIKLFP